MARAGTAKTEQPTSLAPAPFRCGATRIEEDSTARGRIANVIGALVKASMAHVRARDRQVRTRANRARPLEARPLSPRAIMHPQLVYPLPRTASCIRKARDLSDREQRGPVPTLRPCAGSLSPSICAMRPLDLVFIDVVGRVRFSALDFRPGCSIAPSALAPKEAACANSVLHCNQQCTLGCRIAAAAEEAG